MKRTVASLRHFAGAGGLLLLSHLLIVGCSGSDPNLDIAAPKRIGQSEFMELKKGSQNPAELRSALIKNKMEKLKEQGAVVNTTAAGKKSSRPR